MGRVPESAETLIVVVHGLMGVSSQFDFLKRELCALGLDTTKVYVHSAEANTSALRSFYTTTDGIENGGLRLAEEITGIAEANPNLRECILVGNSLGGLYARYAAGVLWGSDDAYARSSVYQVDGATFACPALPCRLSPKLFISVVSPLLGITHGYSVIGLLNSLVCRVSGSQMALTDGPIPLVRRMAEPGTPFMNALSKFIKRIAYGNMCRDVLVPPYSSLLLDADPAAPQSERTCHHGYGCVVDVREDEFTPTHEYSDVTQMAENLRKLGWTRVYLCFNRLVDYIPILNATHDAPLAVHITSHVSCADLKKAADDQLKEVPHAIGHLAGLLGI